LGVRISGRDLVEGSRQGEQLAAPLDDSDDPVDRVGRFVDLLRFGEQAVQLLLDRVIRVVLVRLGRLRQVLGRLLRRLHDPLRDLLENTFCHDADAFVWRSG
jgi:hypothetical protein